MNIILYKTFPFFTQKLSPEKNCEPIEPIATLVLVLSSYFFAGACPWFYWLSFYAPEIEDRGAYCFCPVCHSVLLSETLTLLITFEQWVLELSYCTWTFLVTRSYYWYSYICPCDLGHLWNWPLSGAFVFHKNILFFTDTQFLPWCSEPMPYLWSRPFLCPLCWQWLFLTDTATPTYSASKALPPTPRQRLPSPQGRSWRNLREQCFSWSVGIL